MNAMLQDKIKYNVDECLLKNNLYTPVKLTAAKRHPDKRNYPYIVDIESIVKVLIEIVFPYEFSYFKMNAVDEKQIIKNIAGSLKVFSKVNKLYRGFIINQPTSLVSPEGYVYRQMYEYMLYYLYSFSEVPRQRTTEMNNLIIQLWKSVIKLKHM